MNWKGGCWRDRSLRPKLCVMLRGVGYGKDKGGVGGLGPIETCAVTAKDMGQIQLVHPPPRHHPSVRRET